VLYTPGHKLDAAAADFNGDGKPDIVSADYTGVSISVWLQQPGGFAAPLSTPVGEGPRGVLPGDFNGDAKMDVVVANTVSDSVSLLLGKGNGTFNVAGGAPVTVGDGPIGLASADFDRDGKPDVAVANNGAGSVSILRGTGTGLVAAGGPLALGASGAYGIAAADFDGDGRPDLAVANNGSSTVSVLRNAPPPPPPPDLDADDDNVQRPADCRDDDPTVFPGAFDVPGDGIDQDCVGGDAPVPRLRRTVAYKLGYGRAFTIFSLLEVKPARQGDRVTFRCKGKGCKKKKAAVDVARDAARVKLTKYVKGAKLEPGARIAIRVTHPASIGRYRRFTIRSGKLPKQIKRCLPPGSATPVKCSA
jgi:hypothetical protein